ncbi:MAG: FG-GAP-like repeat-containing protein [Bacteroidota bacterium]
MSHTSGVAVADFDQDQDLDVFIVAKKDFDAADPISASRLWQNNNDGTFTDITQAAGLGGVYDFDQSDLGWEYGVKLGASWGDYDNDGFPDLFLTNYQHNQLFHNEGDGTFAEVSAQAGIQSQDSCYYTSALWWDFDQDGYLDLYVSKWGFCAANKLYHNQGDGSFVEIAVRAGIEGGQSKTWMAIPIDANHDGKWDLYLANDFAPNELFIQDSTLAFSEAALNYGLNQTGNDMGISTGDYNNDGLLDLFISNIAENRLLEQAEDHTFSNRAAERGVLNTYWAWDTRFGDFDLDGDADLFVANGYQNDALFFPLLKTNFLFQNQLQSGQANFSDWSQAAGIKEHSNSMSSECFDYDNDGDLDILISNMNDAPFLYDNKSIDGEPAASWAKIKLVGTLSNRDGLGAKLMIYSEGEAQYQLYHGAGLLGQSLQPVHFGLAQANKIDSIVIVWPNQLRECFYDLAVNHTIEVIENQGINILDIKGQKIKGCTDPQSCTYNPAAIINDGSCQYLPSFEIMGPTEAHYLAQSTYTYPAKEGSTCHWEVEHGEILSGQGTAQIVLKWHLADSAYVSVTESQDCSSKSVHLGVNLSSDQNQQEFSVARLWNEALLAAIRKDYARPTVHARNLFHTSIVMYDAWAVYDSVALTYLLGQSQAGFQSRYQGFTPQEPIAEARRKSVSYAAYRLLTHRFQNSPGHEVSQAIFDMLMKDLGYEIDHYSIDYQTGDASALGNFIASEMIAFGLQDGAREASGYDNAFYQAANPPLVLPSSGNASILNPNHWQPLALGTFIDQSGNLIPGSTPDFLSPEWGTVVPFALKSEDRHFYTRAGHQYAVYHDPGNPPYLNLQQTNLSHEAYQWGFSLVSLWGSHLAPDDSVIWDISPAAIGNISLADLPQAYSDYPDFYKFETGGDRGEGRAINPKTQQAYQPQWVPRGDYTRVLAEFWADGPDSETPPGHWFVLLNRVNDHPLSNRQLNGKGRTLTPLEWEVKSYFVLGGAMHDAAIAAWSIKGWYDYIRPISAIRFMAEQGQSSDPSLPNYSPQGLPLLDGYVELVASGDPLAGENGENLDQVKLFTWRGHDYINDPATDQAGVGWILAKDWMPYQRPSFVTPPFAGFVSGHSTFSRAAAEVMGLLTGDEFFPGGLGEFIARKNEFLVFEEGPSQDVVLQWATYRDASDQCSLSRIWGGIHPPADDLPGRRIGATIGQSAYEFALPYFEGSVPLQAKELNPHPNPISGHEWLYIPNTRAEQGFRLMDLQGRQMPIERIEYQQEIRTTALLLGELSPGIYLLNTETQSWKILIK